MSDFYNSYPTKGSGQLTGEQMNQRNRRLGYFDDLRLYCGLGWAWRQPLDEWALCAVLFAKEADLILQSCHGTI
jgi:hypothetical protein